MHKHHLWTIYRQGSHFIELIRRCIEFFSTKTYAKKHILAQTAMQRREGRSFCSISYSCWWLLLLFKFFFSSTFPGFNPRCPTDFGSDFGSPLYPSTGTFQTYSFMVISLEMSSHRRCLGQPLLRSTSCFCLCSLQLPFSSQFWLLDGFAKQRKSF